jgi:cell volume regulation protein A
MGEFENLMFFGALLLVLSVLSSKIGGRLGIPTLLLFLGLGILSGPHGLGALQVADFRLAQDLGVLALIFILFSGGMDTKITAVQSVLRPAISLSTLGVLVVAGLVSVFAWQFLGLSLAEGGLLGATVAATDVAAVFTALRAKSIRLNGDLGALLELESALNDPMTVFVSVTFLTLSQQSTVPLLSLILNFGQQVSLGLAAGWLAGKAAVYAINRVKLEFEGLYPVLVVAWILLTYAATQKVGGGGFLAVYVAGIIIGNAHLLHKQSLVHFHEGIAWLAQIVMFLTMGLLVSPTDLLHIAPYGIAVSFFLLLVARPMSVFLSLLGTRFSAREKWLVSWAGLRGAVPIILASYVLAAKIPHAGEIFSLVFFVTTFSLLLQGSSMAWVARKLGLLSRQREKVRFPIEFNPSEPLSKRLVEVQLNEQSPLIGRSLVQLQLPKDILVLLIERQGEVVVPRGATTLTSQDTLLVLTEKRSTKEVQSLF